MEATHASEQCGVGISLLLDQIVNVVVSSQQLGSAFSVFDVLIYSQLATDQCLRRKLEIAEMLWNSGIQANVSISENTHSLEEAHALAQEAGASFVVIIGDSDFDQVRIELTL